MDTLTAGMLGMINRGKEQKVFDWEKAAYTIKHYLESHENDDIVIEASLYGDEGNTFGDIYSDGKFNIHDSGIAYLASTWASPQIRFFNYSKEETDEGDESWDDDPNVDLKLFCYKMQHEVPDWNYATWCPQIFIDILETEILKKGVH